MKEEAQDLEPLALEKIIRRLEKLPGWTYKDGKIEKTFKFPTFNTGLQLVNTLAPFCNMLDHHPDICISYKTINFSLTRYSIGGKVTERDFIVAEKIEELYRQIGTNGES